MTWWFTFELIWFLLLLLFLSRFIRLYFMLKKATHFLETKGDITECRWRLVDEGYWPDVSYVYHVDGKPYQGHKIFLDNFEPDPRTRYCGKPAFQWFSSFKEGEKVSVYYDADAPDLAVLSIAIPRKLYLINAALVIVACGQFIFMLLRII